MSVVKKRLRVGGMECVGCQSRIERKLKNTPGIQDAAVSYRTGYASIAYDSAVIGPEKIGAIIERLGYSMLPDGQAAWPGREAGLLAVIVLIYMALQRLGILNYLVPGQMAGAKTGYGMLFVIGLTTSVHCVAMCGGLNLSQSLRQSEDGGGKLAAFRPTLMYNLGRVISYTAVGFVLGLAGLLIGGGNGTGISAFWQGLLKIAAGIFMVVTGLNMLNIFPWLRRFALRLPVRPAAKVRRNWSRERQALTVGLFNGLMPCGPLQSVQIVALASGNPLSGALSMLLFSLGTTPLMLGFGSAVSALGQKFSRRVMTAGAVIVAVLGLTMLSQGGSLSGLLPPERLLALVIALCVTGLAAGLPLGNRRRRAALLTALMAVMLLFGAVVCHLNEAADPEATGAEGIVIQDGTQVIRSTLERGRYPSVSVAAGIPVKWVIDAPEGTINGCNYRMLIPEYGIEHTFSEGENVIEFVPDEPGTVQYTCWMGMIRGYIFVTDEDGTEAG